MTDNNTISLINREHRKLALIYTVICGASLLGLYFYGSQWLQETTRQVAQTQQAQLDTSEKLEQNEQRVGLIQSELASIRTAVTQKGLKTDDVNQLRARLAIMEQALDSIPAQAGKLRNSLDQRNSAQARGAARLVSLLHLVQRTDVELKSAAQSIRHWDQQLSSVLHDERGQRIAANPEAVQRLATMRSKQIASKEDVATWVKELQIAAAPFQEAQQKQQSFPVTDDDVSFFQKLLERATSANVDLSRRQQLVEREIAAAQSLTPVIMTLEQSIAHSEQQLTQAFIDKATKTRQAALQQAIQSQSLALQKADEERIAAETQVRLAQKEAERLGLEQQRQQVQQGNSAAMAAAARKQLETDFARDQAEIKSLLSPFLGESDRQPTVGQEDDPSTWIVVSNPSRPVSYGRLKGAKALEDTPISKRRLLFIGGSPMNFRRTGSFPIYSRTGLNSKTTEQTIDRTRELLLKYGDLMVEKGLLSQ